MNIKIDVYILKIEQNKILNKLLMDIEDLDKNSCNKHIEQDVEQHVEKKETKHEKRKQKLQEPNYREKIKILVKEMISENIILNDEYKQKIKDFSREYRILPHKTAMSAIYRELVDDNIITKNKNFEKLISYRKTRSQSGVVVVTVS